MKVLSRLDTIFEKMIIALKNIALLLLVLITLMGVLEVLLLNLFNVSVAWMLEVSEYALAYIVFLAAAKMVNHGGLIKIDIFVKSLGTKTQLVLELIGNFICFLVSLIITTFGLFKVLSLYEQGVRTQSVLELPKGLLLVIIPLGFFFLTLEFLRTMIRLVLQSRMNEKR